MANQTKHLAALSDVKAVVLQCTKCGSSLSYAFARNGRIPVSCHSCGRDWVSAPSPAADFNAISLEFMNVKRGLQEALEIHALSLGYTMSLLVDIEETSGRAEEFRDQLTLWRCLADKQ